MKFTIKIFITTFVLFTATAIFYSCKKTANEEPTTTKEHNDLLDLYRQKLKTEPTVTNEIINLPGKAYYGDINGNPITLRSGKSNKSASSTCPDPSDTEAEQIFYSMTREYTCGVGYRFVVSYKITSEFYPVYGTSPYLSGGRVRLRNSSQVTIYTTPFALLTNIQNNGVVGHTSTVPQVDLNEFIVTYRTDIVPESIYNSAATIQPNALIYTDCIDIPTINILYSPQQSSSGSAHNTLPCLRIDKVHWNPSGGGAPPSLSGANPAGSGCFPNPYVYPDKQEIWFKNGSGVWKKFYLHINGLPQAGVETYLINYFDVWYIDVSLSQSANGLVPGNVEVRYRNDHTNGSGNGAPCVTIPADTWVTEIWYIN